MASTLQNPEFPPAGYTNPEADGHPSHPLSSNPNLQHQPLRAPSFPQAQVDEGGQPPPIPHADPDVGYAEQANNVYDRPPSTYEQSPRNLFLVITLVLAAIMWLVALVSQSFVTANLFNVRTAWFALILQLVLLIILTLLLFTRTSIPLHFYHTQLAILSALVSVFAIIAVDANIYSPNAPSQRAVAAAWLVTAIIDLAWVLYFTSPPESPLARALNGTGDGNTHTLGIDPNTGANIDTPNKFGNFKFTPKSGGGRGGVSRLRVPSVLLRRNRRNQDPEIQNRNAIDMGTYGTTNSAPRISTIQSHGDSHSRVVSGVEGEGDVSGSAMDESRGRLSSIAEANSGGGLKGGQRKSGGMRPDSGATTGRETASDVNKPIYRAEALFGYTAAPEDPGELSFKKGEILDILDRTGKWWEARRSDGTVGIAPSNYLRLQE